MQGIKRSLKLTLGVADFAPPPLPPPPPKKLRISCGMTTVVKSVQMQGEEELAITSHAHCDRKKDCRELRTEGVDGNCCRSSGVLSPSRVMNSYAFWA